jgi:ribosomal protein L12E/L44/L45/RPP1/RPP2
VLFGLGLPEWLTIIGLLGGLILTFYIMARASVAYEAKRKAREAGSAGSQERNEQREQENQNAEEESGT